MYVFLTYLIKKKSFFYIKFVITNKKFISLKLAMNKKLSKFGNKI